MIGVSVAKPLGAGIGRSGSASPGLTIPGHLQTIGPRCHRRAWLIELNGFRPSGSPAVPDAANGARTLAQAVTSQFFRHRSPCSHRFPYRCALCGRSKGCEPAFSASGRYFVILVRPVMWQRSGGQLDLCCQGNASKTSNPHGNQMLFASRLI